MKKVLFLVLFFSTMVFAKESVLVNTIKNISIPNVENAINDAKILQKDNRKGRMGYPVYAKAFYL